MLSQQNKSKNKKVSRKYKKSISRYNFNRKNKKQSKIKLRSLIRKKSKMEKPQKGGVIPEIKEVSRDSILTEFIKVSKEYINNATSDKHYLDLNLLKNNIKSNISLKSQHLYDLVYQSNQLTKVFDHGIYNDNSFLETITAGLPGKHVYVMKNLTSNDLTVVGVFERILPQII